MPASFASGPSGNARPSLTRSTVGRDGVASIAQIVKPFRVFAGAGVTFAVTSKANSAVRSLPDLPDDLASSASGDASSDRAVERGAGAARPFRRLARGADAARHARRRRRSRSRQFPHRAAGSQIAQPFRHRKAVHAQPDRPQSGFGARRRRRPGVFISLADGHAMAVRQRRGAFRAGRGDRHRPRPGRRAAHLRRRAQSVDPPRSPAGARLPAASGNAPAPRDPARRTPAP